MLNFVKYNKSESIRDSSDFSRPKDTRRMNCGSRSKYSGIWALFLIPFLIYPVKCLAEEGAMNRPQNLEPFLDTISALKGESLQDSLEDLEEEFNMKFEEKKKIDLESMLGTNEDKTKVNSQEFKNATVVLMDGNLDENQEEEEELSPEKEEETQEYYYKEDKGSEKEEEGSSRRILKLNVEPPVKMEVQEVEEEYSERNLFQEKMIQVIMAMQKLKKEIIEKNMELDNLFLQVDQLRMNVNQTEDRVYRSLLKDMENLTKDLNLIRKGNIYNGESNNILNNLTLMEALHGLYVIYRTPFILLRHNFKVYAALEMLLYKLFTKNIPSLLKKGERSTGRMLKNLMNYSYGKTLKVARNVYLKNNFNQKAMGTYDSLMAEYLKSKFKVDVKKYNNKGRSKLVGKLGSLLTKMKVVKHYKYIKHSLVNNEVIALSFINRNGTQRGNKNGNGNGNFLYIKEKDHKMIEILYHIYRLKLVNVSQKLALQLLRHAAVFCNLFVKDSMKNINTYTKPLFNLREDSLLRIKNQYCLLRSVSIATLQKVDVIMDYFFNYANKLNPELSILVPKDLSNRIFFISVIILLTFFMVFVAQFVLYSVAGFVNSLFSSGTGSRSGLHSKFRHWYHRSSIRHFVHTVKRGFQHKTHKKKHRYHRNFDNFHRVIDERNVTNSDNYKQFKQPHKNG